MQLRFRRVLPLIIVIAVSSALGGCSYIEDPLLESEGIVRLSMPLVEGYAPDRYFYRLTPSENVEGGGVVEGLLSPGDAAATANMVLPLGDWTISGRLDKNWDESSAYNVPIAEESFTVTVASDQTVGLTNPFSESEAASFSVRADGSDYIAALGVPGSDEFVGVFLNSTDPDGANYHFHATDDDDDSSYTAVFDRIAPGEYEVEVIATNWSYWGEESVWNRELSASNSARLQITDDAVYDPPLLFEIFQDFSGTSEYFEQVAEGSATIERSAGRLYGLGATDGIARYGGTVSFAPPKLYSFNYEPADNSPNPDTLLVNLFDNQDSDTSLQVALSVGGVEARVREGSNYTPLGSYAASSLPADTAVDVAIYVADRTLHLWLNPIDLASSSPDWQVEVPETLGLQGRTSFHFVNEAYIDDVLIRNDVRNEYGP